MKQIYIYIAILTGLFISFTSCKKDLNNEPITQEINVKLKVNESYQLDLGSFSKEEKATINSQALHYLTSTLIKEPGNNISGVTYNYTPEEDFVGKDEVKLKIDKASNGAILTPTTLYILINLTISN